MADPRPYEAINSRKRWAVGGSRLVLFGLRYRLSLDHNFELDANQAL